MLNSLYEEDSEIKNSAIIKQLFKDVLVETLIEQRNFLKTIFLEVLKDERLEDVALIAAIQEGQLTEEVTREEVFRIFEKQL